MKVELVGTVKVKMKLATITEETQLLIKQELAKSALEIQREAKKKCPVDTGRLRASIAMELKGLTAKVGSNVEYAPYVEFGTKRQKAQPYLRPAFEQEEPRLKAGIERILKSL